MLDLEAHLAANAVQVIVVEGLMTLHHAPLRDLLDLGIFVDAPSDERIVRRLKRNLAAGHAFDDIAAFFLDSVRFRHQEFVEPSRWHADVVLNGSYPSARGLQVVVDWIRQRTNGDRPR
jgi:uridine kinase